MREFHSPIDVQCLKYQTLWFKFFTCLKVVDHEYHVIIQGMWKMTYEINWTCDSKKKLHTIFFDNVTNVLSVAKKKCFKLLLWCD
jgi:hypothetical protein